jgi:heme/copper-type cytochrome/quinol oxidase subunit 2
MFFRVKVVSQSEYTTWLASNANAGAAQAAQAATNQQTSSVVPTKSSKSEGNN